MPNLKMRLKSEVALGCLGLSKPHVLRAERDQLSDHHGSAGVERTLGSSLVARDEAPRQI